MEINNYFENDMKIYDHTNIKEIPDEVFKNIVAFEFVSTCAMGKSGAMLIVTSDNQKYSICHLQKKVRKYIETKFPLNLILHNNYKGWNCVYGCMGWYAAAKSDIYQFLVSKANSDEAYIINHFPSLMNEWFTKEQIKKAIDPTPSKGGGFLARMLEFLSVRR